MEDIGSSELELKVVCAGNCIACGKPINLVMHRADNKIPDIFLCKTCMEKIIDGQSVYCISPEDVETLPSVNSQPKTGHWVYKIYGGFHEEGNWHCSKCDYVFNGGYGHAKFCPECGCKMSEAPTEEVIEDRDYDWIIKR